MQLAQIGLASTVALPRIRSVTDDQFLDIHGAPLPTKDEARVSGRLMERGFLDAYRSVVDAVQKPM